MQSIYASIKKFETLLYKQIELLSSPKLTENVSNSNYDEIAALLGNQLIDNKLSIKSINELDPIIITKVLQLTGENEESISYIVSKIELEEYKEKIVKIINKYIEDYISYGTHQNEFINNKIELYKRYIELITKENFSEPFVDISELSSVITEVGLDNENKWKILTYIAKKNIGTIKEVDLSLTSRVNESLDEIFDYIEDLDILKQIEERLKETIDIDLIETISSELESTINLDKNIINNIIVVLFASSFLEQLNSLEDIEEESKEELKNLINDLLDHKKKVHKKVYYDAKRIKYNTQEYYHKRIENGITEEMILNYLDTPITIIEEDGVTREEAIDLKELSVLKSIYETIDTIDSLDMEDDNYLKAIDVLTKLVEQYNLLENKKEKTR